MKINSNLKYSKHFAFIFGSHIMYFYTRIYLILKFMLGRVILSVTQLELSNRWIY